MGTFLDPSGAVDSTLQSYILAKLALRPRGTLVSMNAIVAEIRSELPRYHLSDAQMIKVMSESAMLLGLVPVMDREEEPSFGYGYPAHRPDPSAVYVFSPGKRRTLPVRANRHLRLAK